MTRSVDRRPLVPGPWRGEHKVGHLSRRGLLAAGAAAIGLLAIGRPAHSLEAYHTTSLLPEIPERAGFLPWRTLRMVTGDGWSEMFAFAPEVEALDGAEVMVEGYMLPYDDQPKQRAFLLTAFPAHCPYCMPGGMSSLIEVDAAKAVPVSATRITLKGRLELLRGDGYGLLYRLSGAVAA